MKKRASCCFWKPSWCGLRIEAENLKLRKAEESKTRQGNQLIKLADVAYQLSQTRLLSQRALFSTSRRRHWIWLLLAVILGLSR